ncbi:MAG TPA: acyl carrier protein [Polyangia bacterium]|jgi:acyl carrier protein|nr:acyl carrier protein [Polyangia bacterium]
MQEETESTVEEFIRTRFRVRSDDEFFTRDVNLWDAGYVDSAGAVEMIAYLERTFAVTLPEEVLFDPDFTHIRGIARLIARRA